MPQEYRLILKNVDAPGYTPDLECYVRHGGYEALKKALTLAPKDLPDSKKMSPQEQIRDEVKTSGLRGRGGAGFSCGLKWSFVDLRGDKPKYLICNADESEPGTFKDRQIIHKDPHQLLEGMIIACYANNVHLAYVYIRGEMPGGGAASQPGAGGGQGEEFSGQKHPRRGYDLEIYIHRGAGAYICGEETGLIESLEGKRAYPRIKPPYFPAILGLYQCPTIVNNVETLAAVKHIVLMGGAAYARLGALNNTGTRIVSISGHVPEARLLRDRSGQGHPGRVDFPREFRRRPAGGAAAQGGHSRRLLGQGLQGGRKIQAQETKGRTARWRRWRWTCWICPTISIPCKAPGACPVRARSL